MPNQIPSRFTVPNQQSLADVYDKLNFLLSQQAAVKPTPTPTPVTTTATSNTPSAPAQTGIVAPPAPSTQFAIIPSLDILPSSNPAQGMPYTVNDLVVLVNEELWQYYGTPLYQWKQISTGTVLISDTHANRVVNYPASKYPDALFIETDTLLLLWSEAGIWTTLAGTVEDTHANRLTTWPSVQFSPGTQFLETDRTVMYVVENATGTVTVSGGTNVAWVSGNHFVNTLGGFTAVQWPVGTEIIINGLTGNIATVSSDTALTLQMAMANGTHAYSVVSGRWVYLSGECSTAQANIPSDLGENDATTVGGVLVAGFLENVNDYGHILQWNGSAYTWGPGEEGSGQLQPFAVAPTAVGWIACTGGSVSYLRSTGSLGSITLPNTNASPAYMLASGSYLPTINAAVPPTVKPTGTVSQPTFAGNPAGAVTVQSGTGASVVGAPYTPSGIVSQPTFTGDTDTTDLSGGDPIANFAVLLYFRQ